MVQENDRVIVPAPDPTVLRRRLRKELQKAREATGKTQREVAMAMDWSISKLIRIEAGEVRISTNDLRVLLAHYGISDEARVEELLNIARDARKHSWWHSYRDVATDEYLTFLGYESSAWYIRNFEPVVVPGLLQTEDYAREIIETYLGRNNKEAAQLVDLRMERQERLLNDNGPKMYFLIDEAVVSRVVGSSDLMMDQLNHLIDLDKRPNIEVLIFPFKAGFHALCRTSMVHFVFEEPDVEDILYIEGPGPIPDLILGESESGQSNVSPSKYLDLFWTVEHTARNYDAGSLIQDALERLAKLRRRSAE
jgi:transcriptional regulator with XRE-family HTH domain